ncbi:MAG: tRNA 2-thiouridine(34) synthase MnmA [Kiritimatiellia bacterium]
MKIGVAVSGGVDSAVALRLLLEQGYEVEAWHMLAGCASPDPAVAPLCDALGVPLHVVDLRSAFEHDVITPFYDAYATGCTPNPCAWCNPRMKFGRLREAMSGGLIATGHYVGKAIEPQSGVETLQSANDSAKDQSYFLYALTPEILAETVFPLAHKTRAEVVALALKWELPIAASKLTSGSQDICFIPEGDYRPELLRRHPEATVSGDILDIEGRVIGRHTGLANYTRGQRRGIGVATGGRAFVVALDWARNTLTLGPREALFTSSFRVSELNWIVPPTFPVRCQAVTRYHHAAFECELSADGIVTADSPQSFITEGQCCVFYRGAYLLGGGLITK